MKVLKRGEIIVIDSNLIDNTPSFDINASYKKGDRVKDDKFIYEALDNTQNNDLDDSFYWENKGASNEYACFDYFLNSASAAQGEINLTFSCFNAKGLYLANLQARYLKIEAIDSFTGNIIDTKEFNLISNTMSWSEYFFRDRATSEHLNNFFYEVKTFLKNITFRLKLWGVGQISLGSIIAGDLISLGTTLYEDNSISMLDFSKAVTDEEGNTELVKGNFKRTNAFKLIIKDSELNHFMREITKLRGEALVFVIADTYECLINFGFLKAHDLLLKKPGHSIVNIEIEGLV